MMVFCKFANGRQTGSDGLSDEEAVGYVKGLEAASLCLGTDVWVARSLPNEAGIDHDSWLSPSAWLESRS